MNNHITLPIAPRAVAHSGNEATFVIENCFPGYGITLGNSLQRVLLSSLSGAAVIGAKIEGADHEFTTLDGVLEDVLTILLNLKKVKLNLSSDEAIRGTLNIKGGKGEVEVTAGNFKFPSEVKVIDPKIHLATLTSAKVNLKIEVVVERGLGYRTATENRATHDFEAGMMAIDSIFSPVAKVNYRIDNMRVGERTDFNRLTLTIGTDGSLTPEDALAQASQTLADQFTRVAQFAAPEAVKAAKKSGKKKAAGKAGEPEGGAKTAAVALDTLADLKLSSRITNIFEENGVGTIDALLNLGESKLGQIPGIGDKAVKEIRRKLGRLGLILNK